jgi:hypothetical protein
MTVKLKAPYPQVYVTSVLPDPTFDNSRSPDGRVFRKWSMLGRRITYRETSDTETLVLPFVLTSQKSLEVDAFVKAFQSAKWQVELPNLYGGSVWVCQLIGQPVRRRAMQRGTGSVAYGPDDLEVTLTLSSTRLQ